MRWSLAVAAMATTAAALAPPEKARLAQAYGKALGQSSGIDGATATKAPSGGAHIRIARSRPDVDANRKHAQALSYRLGADGSLERAPGVEDVPSDVHARVQAPSGKTALFRSSDDAKSVEIYEDAVLVQRVALDPKKVGKLLVTDVMVGGASWNADESLLAFVADAPPPEPKPFEGAFKFREELGEKYVGVSAPRVFTVDLLQEGSLTALEYGEGVAFEGQPAFHPKDPKSLVTVVWAIHPRVGARKMGLVYCFNRPSEVWIREDVRKTERRPEGNATQPQMRLMPDLIARCPRWRPDGGAVCYLGSDDLFYTHDGPVELKLWVPGEAVRVLVAAPPAPDYVHECPGLWGVHRLLDDCWADNDTIVLTSLRGSAPTVLFVDANSGAVKRLASVGAYRALCTFEGTTIVHASSPADAAGRLLAVDATGEVAATAEAPALGVVSGPTTFDGAPAALRFDVLELGPFEAWLLYEAGGDAPKPLVVVPHGGPHSCSRLEYSAPLAFLAALGYAVLCPNYRGSIGFGTRTLNSLPGKVGANDVKDVVKATEAALAFEVGGRRLCDKSKVAVVGGSHGGFLGAHLVGQSDLFHCAALRNPVTNMAAMVGVTDIPDWCHVEGKTLTSAAPAEPETLERLYARSPVAHVDEVDVPVLIALGMQDRRVPPSQGLDFYHALRARGVPTGLLVYPDDDHALDKPRTAADHWVEIAAFLAAALASKQRAWTARNMPARGTE